MKKIFYVVIFSLTVSLFIGFNAWPQMAPQRSDAPQGEKGIITQGWVAGLIGERLGYKEEAIARLKQAGVTPLGEWDPMKALTKDDLDAILVRIARRNPVAEKMEPSKLLDSMGLPSRDVSQEGIRRLLESDAFERVAINLKLFVSANMMPLPRKYTVGVEGVKEAAPLEALSVAITPAALTPGPPPGPPEDPLIFPPDRPEDPDDPDPKPTPHS